MRRLAAVILVSAFILSGCNAAKPEEKVTEVTVTETSVTEPAPTPTSTPTPTPTPEPIRFNPHVHSDILSAELNEEGLWESFYNMCDALRAGEDSFSCKSKKVYDMVSESIMTGDLFPAACMVTELAGYEDGVARIKYNIGKEEFLLREKVFEEEIERILNESVKSDYTEFEKIMGLYEYMCTNVSYDHSTMDNPSVDEFSTYACLMTKKGICTEVASAYAYLLLQVGVDALHIEEYKACHAWTYVVCGGKGYHVDATWGQRQPGENLLLQYFMQTDEERKADGMDVDGAEIHPITWFHRDFDKSKYTATDDRYKIFHWYAIYKGMDTDRKVIFYMPEDTVLEFKYED